MRNNPLATRLNNKTKDESYYQSTNNTTLGFNESRMFEPNPYDRMHQNQSQSNQSSMYVSQLNSFHHQKKKRQQDSIQMTRDRSRRRSGKRTAYGMNGQDMRHKRSKSKPFLSSIAALEQSMASKKPSDQSYNSHAYPNPNPHHQGGYHPDNSYAQQSMYQSQQSRGNRPGLNVKGNRTRSRKQPRNRPQQPLGYNQNPQMYNQNQHQGHRQMRPQHKPQLGPQGHGHRMPNPVDNRYRQPNLNPQNTPHNPDYVRPKPSKSRRKSARVGGGGNVDYTLRQNRPRKNRGNQGHSGVKTREKKSDIYDPSNGYNNIGDETILDLEGICNSIDHTRNRDNNNNILGHQERNTVQPTRGDYQSQASSIKAPRTHQKLGGGRGLALNSRRNDRRRQEDVLPLGINQEEPSFLNDLDSGRQTERKRPSHRDEAYGKYREEDSIYSVVEPKLRLNSDKPKKRVEESLSSNLTVEKKDVPVHREEISAEISQEVDTSRHPSGKKPADFSLITDSRFYGNGGLDTTKKLENPNISNTFDFDDYGGGIDDTQFFADKELLSSLQPKLDPKKPKPEKPKHDETYLNNSLSDDQSLRQDRIDDIVGVDDEPLARKRAKNRFRDIQDNTEEYLQKPRYNPKIDDDMILKKLNEHGILDNDPNNRDYGGKSNLGILKNIGQGYVENMGMSIRRALLTVEGKLDKEKELLRLKQSFKNKGDEMSYVEVDRMIHQNDTWNLVLFGMALIIILNFFIKIF